MGRKNDEFTAEEIRVAKASYEALRGKRLSGGIVAGYPWDDPQCDPRIKADWCLMARAAIKAIRKGGA